MKKEKKVEKDNDGLILTIALPFLIVFIVAAYLFLGKLSHRYSRVCNFMGKIWISQAQMTENKPEGCYTYRELAQIKFQFEE